MKWTDEDIDKLFQQQAGATPAYSPDFWKEVEKQLPTEKRKRRFGFLWIGVSVIFGLGLFLVIVPKAPLKPIQAQKGTTSIPFSTKKHTQQIAETASNDLDDNISALSQQKIGYKTAPITPQQFEETSSTSSRTQIAAQQLTPTSNSDVGVSDAPKVLENLPLKSFELLDRELLQAKLMHTAHQEQKPNRAPFSTHLAVGAGQSPQMNTPGLYHNIGVVTFGFQLHNYSNLLRFSAGAQLNYTYSNNIVLRQKMSTTEEEVTQLSNLYALQFPLQLVRQYNHFSFGLTLTPGVQALYKGTFMFYQDGELTREITKIGIPQKVRTTTLQLGGTFEYQFNPKWGITGNGQINCLKPFQSSEYFGDARSFPFQCNIGVIRFFSFK